VAVRKRGEEEAITINVTINDGRKSVASRIQSKMKEAEEEEE
jgi:hypothetical protein